MALIEEFQKAKAEALALVKKAKDEGKALTAEDKQTVEKHFARMREIEELLKTEKAVNALEIDSDSEIQVIATQTFSKQDNKEEKKMVVSNSDNVEMIDAIKHFARTGDRKPYEKFTVTSATTSGLYMPKGIPGLYNVPLNRNSLRKGFALLGVPTFNTGDVTDNIVVPVVTDSSNTANNDQEGATSGAAADASGASNALNLVEYHSKAEWFSKKVVRANAFDVTQYAMPRAVSRIERAEDAAWVATLVADTNIVGKTTASTTAVTLPELIDWDESFDAGLDGLPKFFIVTKALRTAIRKLAESTNKPFFGVENGLETLFGCPVVTSANFEAMTAGKVIGAMVCVDGTFIRDTNANEFYRYEGESGRPHQIGFEMVGFSAFNYASGSIKTLKTAAS